jgi:outer membrane protein OmpA-like peptidoglycan-associated protein
MTIIPRQARQVVTIKQRSNGKRPLCSFFIVLFSLFFCALLPAQTADEIGILLQTQAVSHQQAAALVLEAAKKNNSEALGQTAAFDFATRNRWLPGKADSSDAIKLHEASLLIMRAFDIKGGFLYSLFKNPHYAYREMVYQDVIQGRSDPRMAVSGELLLFLVNRVLYRTDDDPWNWTEEPIAVLPPEEIVIEETPLEEELALVDEINTQLEILEVSDVSARLTDEGVTISLSNIQFLANSAELPERERQALREIALILNAIPARKILVTGHTALAGTEGDRLRTSFDRAQAVAIYLIALGVRNANEITVQGYGSLRPVADNNTPEGMALNRRVEITILEDQQ